MNNTLNVNYINIEKSKVSTLNEVLSAKFSKINDSYLNSFEKSTSVNTLIILDFEDLLKLNKNINNPIILYLKTSLTAEQFVLAFEFNIIDVVILDLDKARLTKMAKKVSAAFIYNKLPSNIVDYITKASIKVKSLDLLSEYLTGYFKLFDTAQLLSFIVKTKEGFQYIQGQQSPKIESYIKNLSLKEKYIGSFFNVDGKFLIPVNNEGGNIVWIIVESESESEDNSFLNDLLFIHLNRINLYKKLKNSVGKLTQISMTDEVTDLFNQRKLNADLEHEVKVCLEKEKNFSLLFIDIDHFKKVNDSYGHVVGSQFLKDLGEVLVKQVRGTDSVYRYGGDEFIILMRNTKTSTVYSVAKRMLASVKEHTFKINKSENYKMSVSIGIAEFPKDAKSAREIIEFADEMMYKSKDSGRGKVFHVKEISE